MKTLIRWKWLLVVVVLIALSAGGYFSWAYWRAGRNSASASKVLGQTVRVTRGDVVQSLTAYGAVVPKQKYTFTFAGDKISELLVKVGNRVEPGQILVKLDNAREELALLQAKRSLEEAKAEGIPATIQEKELAYQIALDEYERTTLRAPFAGVVAEINQATTSSEAWTLVLIDTSELYIEASVDQLDAPGVAVGQKGTAVIEPLPERTWPVEIVDVGGMAKKSGNSTTVTVTAKLPEPDPSILVGFTVEMEIITASAKNVLRVPISSLIKTPRGWMVMKVENGEAKPQPVQIGVVSDQYAEIKSGLEEGDEILLSPRGVGTATGESTEGSTPQRFQQPTAPSVIPGMPPGRGVP
jgi:macrolide-specific efflux system membrane fusion protein